MKIKIPENPPRITLDDKNLDKLSKIMGHEDIQKIVQKANREYIYWDKFKYAMPENVGSPELGWFYLKMTRKIQAQYLLLFDKENAPFNFWMPGEIVKKLQNLDSLAGGQILLEETGLTPEARDKYLANSLMEEAISSSILEGAATTREKAKELLLSGKKPKSQPDRMVFNNYRTIKKIRGWKDQPLTVNMLHEIHLSITEDTLKNPSMAGRFRTERDEPIVVGDDYGTTFFTPPNPNEIEDRILSLINFANGEDPDQEYIHPIIKAIILHFTLAYIHPYGDGNGRTARALFYWFMLKKGYWLTEYVSISSMILKLFEQYYKAFLYTEIDEQDLTYFIHYHLKVLCLTFEELKTYIAKQQKRIQKFSKSLRDYPELNLRQINLLQHALRHPHHSYSIQKHQNYHGITYQTARLDIQGLNKKGFLKKNNIKRGNAFHYNLDKEFERNFEKSLKN